MLAGTGATPARDTLDSNLKSLPLAVEPPAHIVVSLPMRSSVQLMQISVSSSGQESAPQLASRSTGTCQRKCRPIGGSTWPIKPPQTRQAKAGPIMGPMAIPCLLLAAPARAHGLAVQRELDHRHLRGDLKLLAHDPLRPTAARTQHENGRHLCHELVV